MYAYRYGIDIPSDYDIHHIDLDHSNNEIGNLLLLPHALHIRLHECILSGICTIASEALSFKYCNMPVHCSTAAKILKDYAEVYAEVYNWSQAKECEEFRVRGYNGVMPRNYNDLRHE